MMRHVVCVLALAAQDRELVHDLELVVFGWVSSYLEVGRWRASRPTARCCSCIGCTSVRIELVHRRRPDTDFVFDTQRLQK